VITLADLCPADNAIDVAEIKRQNPIVEIVEKYGVDLDQHNTGLCPLHKEKTPSFGVDADKGVFHCFGCGKGGDVIRFVMEHDGVEFVEACERLQGGSTSSSQPRVRTAAEIEAERVRKEEAERKEQRDREFAQEIWRNHIPLWDPAAELGVTYLHKVRGIAPPHPETVAFGRIPFPGTRIVTPTLIIARHDPANGDHVAGIQRIYLTEDAQKCPGEAKFSLGKIKNGRARLINVFPLERLIIAEGVESALSAHRMIGDSDWGCWCMCGPFPKEMPLPDTVTEVLLFADNDENNCSQSKAAALAEWIQSTGRTVDVLVPERAGADANDMLRKP
jgi:DNA primase